MLKANKKRNDFITLSSGLSFFMNKPSRVIRWSNADVVPAHTLACFIVNELEIQVLKCEFTVWLGLFLCSLNNLQPVHEILHMT